MIFVATIADYLLPPNSRSINQPSRPAAGSGRAGAREGCRPGPACTAGGGAGPVICEAIWVRVVNPPFEASAFGR
jgi:hypothetical protein